MALIETSIRAYYNLNYELVRRWSFTLSELETMYPFERDIYLSLVAKELERRASRTNGAE